MNASELKQVLAEIELRPSRRLGQNFLVDGNLANALLRPAGLGPGVRVLEIGPGAGMLTRRILDAGCILTAVEFDWRLAAHLRQDLAANLSFRLVEADACTVDYDALMGPEPYICVANLPYAISSVLLARFLEQANPPAAMYLLLQREVGERLAAGPGNRDYGSLTVRAGLYYEIKIIRRVPASVFFPPPEVESVQLQLILRPELPAVAERKAVARLVAAGFAQRRKKLAKLLAGAGCGSQESIAAAFARLGLNPDARAEEIAPGQFRQLANALLPGGTPCETSRGERASAVIMMALPAQAATPASQAKN